MFTKDIDFIEIISNFTKLLVGIHCAVTKGNKRSLLWTLYRVHMSRTQCNHSLLFKVIYIEFGSCEVRSSLSDLDESKHFGMM